MDRDRKQKLLVASELAGSRFNQITNTLLVYVPPVVQRNEKRGTKGGTCQLKIVSIGRGNEEHRWKGTTLFYLRSWIARGAKKFE